MDGSGGQARVPRAWSPHQQEPCVKERGGSWVAQHCPESGPLSQGGLCWCPALTDSEGVCPRTSLLAPCPSPHPNLRVCHLSQEVIIRAGYTGGSCEVLVISALCESLSLPAHPGPSGPPPPCSMPWRGLCLLSWAPASGPRSREKMGHWSCAARPWSPLAPGAPPRPVRPPG